MIKTLLPFILGFFGFALTLWLMRLQMRKVDLSGFIETMKNSPIRQILLGSIWSIPVWIYLVLFQAK